MRTYPTLGFDPVDNDEAASNEIARELLRATRRLGEVDRVLSGDGPAVWQGQAAEAYRESVGSELRPRVREAYEAFSTASRAFGSWVDVLPGYHRRADALEAQAAAAAARVESTASAARSLGEPAPDADEQARDRHEADARRLSASLDAARAELEQIRAAAERLRDEVVARADTVAAAFETAVKAAPDEPGLWDRLGEIASDVGKALGDAFDWFMENLAPIIQKLARVIGAVATILSIVCFVVGFVFPPAFAAASALATTAKVASLVDLGIQGLRVLHGEDGALQGFVLQAGASALGFGVARAIGPIAVNTTDILKGGLYTPVLAGVSGNVSTGVVATAAVKVNTDFTHALLYWGITSYRDLDGSFGTLREESR